MDSNRSLNVPDTADIVLFAVADGVPHVLLVQRSWDSDAFPGAWALPGGFVDSGETAIEAAYRELREETGIQVAALALVGRYDKPGRDPRGPVISEAFSAVLPVMPQPEAGDDARAAKWIPLHEATNLAFDHDQILTDAKKTLPTTAPAS
ncbi:NUDIX hydrolase [Saccharopolyspora sp. NPDC050389]|uniref:NUDIX hydrolase n=1 Tax=Saccharopolyspora sp. NPDC050389 TaxID=3155516 RepID=UPI0033D869AB